MTPQECFDLVCALGAWREICVRRYGLKGPAHWELVLRHDAHVFGPLT